MSEKIKKILTSIGFQCIAICSVLVLAVVILTVYAFKSGTITIDTNSGKINTGKENGTGDVTGFTYPYNIPGGPKLLDYADDSQSIGLYINSANAAFVDTSSNKIIASKKSEAQVYPASLTKIMTLIVVAENLRTTENLNDTITITADVEQRMKQGEASIFGFEAGEQITVETALHAMMLLSDGIAATELAIYTSGSEEAFVAKMNQKAEDMGLQGTHFTNPTGLHDANHYTTCRDMATILAYAVHNTLCYNVMTKDQYTATYYAKMNDGSYKNINCYIKNERLMTIKDKKYSPEGITYLGCKTGLTDEAKYCFASIGKDTNNNIFVCVTVSAEHYEKYCEDHKYIYEHFIPEAKAETDTETQ